MTTIGFIGSGHIGSQLARLAISTGDSVVMSNSRGPDTLAELIAELGPQASAGTVQDAAERGDIVVVTVPLAAIETIPAAQLAGKLVIDTNNYYFERDGHVAAIDSGETTPSEILQAHLPDSHVVKLFNAIQSGHLATQGVPAGTADRRALPIAGDDAAAKATVTALTDEIGYDVVDVGPLADSWRFDRDQPAYGPKADVAGLTDLLAQAKRASA